MARNNRRAQNRPLPKRVLILCEGETEVAYFKSYIAHNNQGRRFKAVRVEVIKPKKFTPFALFEEAKNA